MNLCRAHERGYPPTVKIGYKLATEAFGPKEIIRQAVVAEQAGFDFVEMSDHYHRGRSACSGRARPG
jgi:alkanesulfonate monooxygenase SsuD/methylene tetrahydromethanopterin reductase-like flavin-dependent oxidoreductase (luciferase family)